MFIWHNLISHSQAAASTFPLSATASQRFLGAGPEPLQWEGWGDADALPTQIQEKLQLMGIDQRRKQICGYKFMCELERSVFPKRGTV